MGQNGVFKKFQIGLFQSPYAISNPVETKAPVSLLVQIWCFTLSHMKVSASIARYNFHTLRTFITHIV